MMLNSAKISLLVCFALLQISHFANGHLECCQNPNMIKGQRCADGKKTALNCAKYIVTAPDNETFNILDDDSLDVFGEYVVVPDRYCLTQLREFEEAALICAEEPNNFTQFLIPKVICAILSLIFLILTIIVYIIVPELRDLQGECTMNSICGLAVSFLFLGIMQTNQLPDFWCVTVAFVTYFAFLYAFFWLNILSVQIWRTVTRPYGSDKIWKIAYYLYGTGASALFLIILLIVQFAPGEHKKPRIGEIKCWFADLHSTFLYFYGPISVILFINIVIFIWVSIKLWRDSVNQNETRTKILKYRFSLYIKLFFIMGLSWIFEVLSAVFDDHGKVLKVFWLITDFVNSLQGVLIFILLVVTRKRAIKGLARTKICGFHLPSQWKKIKDEESEAEANTILSQDNNA